MKLVTTILFVTFFLSLFSCNNKQAQAQNEQGSIDTVSRSENANEIIVYTYKPSINLFNIYANDDSSKVVFVSLSDIYRLSEDPDSIAIPDITKKDFETAQYLKLDSKYRNRLLPKTGISETDSVFVYDYSTNALASFVVKSLLVVANVNFYASSDDWPLTQYDYMIGFEIDKSRLNGFSNLYESSLVYVGKQNPFAPKKLKPIVWNRIESKEYPSTKIKDVDTSYLEEITIGNTYLFETESLRYFLQDYLDNNNQPCLRRLMVVESKTKDVIIDKIYGRGEGTSLTPLNYEGEYNEVAQWTGKLFKDKPPVILGFEYVSFGCNYISIIDKSSEDIYINCDNRH